MRVCGIDNVPQVAEDGEAEGLDETSTDPEERRSAEVAAGAVTQPVVRVPHRPGKWRRAVRRYYTWAELCAVGVSGGDFYVPKLRRSASAAGSDQGPGFDRAGAAGHGAAIRGAGVGGGAGSAGWWGWLVWGVISARDGGAGAAAGALWGSGVSMGWVSGRNARAGWLGNRSVDGVTAGCDCG